MLWCAHRWALCRVGVDSRVANVKLWVISQFASFIGVKKVSCAIDESSRREMRRKWSLKSQKSAEKSLRSRSSVKKNDPKVWLKWIFHKECERRWACVGVVYETHTPESIMKLKVLAWCLWIIRVLSNRERWLSDHIWLCATSVKAASEIVGDNLAEFRRSGNTLTGYTRRKILSLSVAFPYT